MKSCHEKSAHRTSGSLANEVQNVMLCSQGFSHTSCVAISPEDIFNFVYFLVKFLSAVMKIL